MTHDELVRGVVEVVAQVTADQAAQAFLGSLTTRRLEQRSALGSHVVARHLTEHRFEADADGRCAVCGLWERERDIDRNVLNFERFKWGGVRRTDLMYVWHDLERFASEEPVSASEEDRNAFAALLCELDAAPSNITAPKAARTLLRGVKSNKDERSVLLDILGVCSVLETPEQTGFADSFVRADSRPLPPLRFVEQAYPVCWWTGEHGVNRQAAASIGLL